MSAWTRSMQPLNHDHLPSPYYCTVQYHISYNLVMAKRRRKGNALSRLLASKGDSTPSEPQPLPESHGSKLEELVNDSKKDPLHQMYTEVLEHFQPHKEPEPEVSLVEKGPELSLAESTPKATTPENEQALVTAPVSKKRKRISLVELKERAPRPELVEWFDADALEPELLVKIKSTPGVVPVPSNWSSRNEFACFRRDLSYRLPPNIAETGIAAMRDVTGEDQEPVNLRQRTRERIQPRLGRLDQDFRKLHAAIFKSHYRPRLRQFGQLWTDRTSYRAVGDYRLEAMRPGQISSRLHSALGLKPNEKPHFVAKIEDSGTAPGYAAFGVREFSSKPPQPVKLWGEMELDSDSDEDDQDSAPEYEEDST